MRVAFFDRNKSISGKRNKNVHTKVHCGNTLADQGLPL